jgi:hypothetical protein
MKSSNVFLFLSLFTSSVIFGGFEVSIIRNEYKKPIVVVYRTSSSNNFRRIQLAPAKSEVIPEAIKDIQVEVNGLRSQVTQVAPWQNNTVHYSIQENEQNGFKVRMNLGSSSVNKTVILGQLK